MFLLQSFAKINWGLYILGKRHDGYHEIFTPIQKISLCDYIYLKPSNHLRVETSNKIPQEENFVYKGLKLFEELTGIKLQFEVFIEKHIPIGGGLGGGSSNLATVLEFVNSYYGSPLSLEELKTLVGTISSDAPSFLCKDIAVATGRGEKVECITNKRFQGVPITLFVPEGVSAPTKEIYAKVNPSMYASKSEVEPLKGLISTAGPEEVLKKIKNRLGEIFLKLHPSVAEDIDFLQKRCYKKFIVSGSGSSFFTVGSLAGCLKDIDRLKNRYKIISLVTI